MTGEANNIKYSVEPQQIDLGAILYNKTVERDIVISNNGKVPYEFAINSSRLSRPSIVDVSPRNGVVGPGQKETVKLKVRGVGKLVARHSSILEPATAMCLSLLCRYHLGCLIFFLRPFWWRLHTLNQLHCCCPWRASTQPSAWACHGPRTSSLTAA